MYIIVELEPEIMQSAKKGKYSSNGIKIPVLSDFSMGQESVLARYVKQFYSQLILYVAG
jgi:hypothetical protein